MREKDGVVQSSDDQWSGYLSSRRRLLDHIQKVGFGNVVTACGDAHRHYASDLVQDNTDSGVISSEFLATSISSGADGQGVDAYAENQLRHSPHLKATTDKRGYVLCDVTRDTWIGDMKTLDTVMRPNGTLQSWKRYAVEHGRPGLQEA
ncbi:Alkaline phosphatase D precursor [compost metagenome]